MALLEELATFLANAGVGTLGQTIHTYNLPPDPVEALVLRSYGGQGPVWEQESTTPAFTRPRVQVTARGATGAAAQTKAQAAFDALLPLMRGGTLDARKYVRVRPLQEPFDNGRDSQNRYLASFNLEAWRE